MGASEASDGNGNGNGKITYTIRELLGEIKLALSLIDSKLDSKAEKSIVENIDRRMITVESGRITEGILNTQLIKEFRDLQALVTDNQARTLVLETTYKNKQSFDILWIPIIANTIAVVAVIYFTIIHR